MYIMGTCCQKQFGEVRDTWAYKPVRRTCYSALREEEVDAIGIRRTFAICGHDNGGFEVFRLGNVTVNSDFATWIAELLTANQASAMHARDIIEDLVAEYDPELQRNDSTLGNLCRD